MATRRDARAGVAVLVTILSLTGASAARVVPTPRAMSAPRDPDIRRGFQVLIPRDVNPETVKIFFAIKPRGVVPTEPVTTRPGVYDYTLPIAGSSFLRLLIYAPGYRMVTAEFRDAQVNASSPYTLPLVKLPAVRLDGRLVDSGGRPVPNQTLDLTYEVWEAVAYFCGNCMIDGQIPTLEFGRTRTDDGGAFAFDVPNVRDDPFFQRYQGTRRAVPSQHAGTRWYDRPVRPSPAAVRILVLGNGPEAIRCRPRSSPSVWVTSSWSKTASVTSGHIRRVSDDAETTTAGSD